MERTVPVEVHLATEHADVGSLERTVGTALVEVATRLWAELVERLETSLPVPAWCAGCGGRLKANGRAPRRLQQGLGRDEEVGPTPPRQQPGRRGQKDPIGIGEFETGDLPTEDRQLVAQHDDLEVLGAPRAEPQRHQLEQAPGQDVLRPRLERLCSASPAWRTLSPPPPVVRFNDLPSRYREGWDHAVLMQPGQRYFLRFMKLLRAEDLQRGSIETPPAADKSDRVSARVRKWCGSAPMPRWRRR